MIRTLATAVLLIGAATQTAQAISLAGIRCENKELISIMEDNIRNSVFDGVRISSYGVHSGKISKSETAHSSRDKLICNITVQLTAAGSMSTLRLRYSFQAFSSGKLSSTITDR